MTTIIKKISLWKESTLKLNGWMRFIINNLYAFDYFENQIILPNVKYTNLSCKSSMKYFENFTSAMELKIRKKVPGKLCIMFDGWSEAGT